MKTVQTTTHEKKTRLMEAAEALLSAAKDHELNVVNLNKALFYLDLHALRDLGHAVTGNTFIALEMGPVVAKYKQRLIKPLVEAGLAVQLQRGQARPVQLVKKTAHFEFLQKDEARIADKIGKWISSLSATDASKYSHENPGWDLAYSAGLKAHKTALPINLLIAMQQIAACDPWLNEPLTPALKDAFKAADKGEGVSW